MFAQRSDAGNGLGGGTVALAAGDIGVFRLGFRNRFLRGSFRLCVGGHSGVVRVSDLNHKLECFVSNQQNVGLGIQAVRVAAFMAAARTRRLSLGLDANGHQRVDRSRAAVHIEGQSAIRELLRPAAKPLLPFFVSRRVGSDQGLGQCDRNLVPLHRGQIAVSTPTAESRAIRPNPRAAMIRHWRGSAVLSSRPTIDRYDANTEPASYSRAWRR